jgi:hypothetical protein
MTKTDTLALAVGAQVFCTVHGRDRGWYRVTAIRPRDGYIKIDGGFNYWCPPHNFTLTEPEPEHPATKTIDGITYYRTFDRHGRAVYVTVPDDGGDE